jgi:membrane-associated phospholipid phosphatase
VTLGRTSEERELLERALAGLDVRHGLAGKIAGEPALTGIIEEFVTRLQEAFGSLSAVRSRRILDLACGSNSSRSPVTERRTSLFEPWMCRLLLELGAEPVGVDLGDLADESFEHLALDLGVPGALDVLPSASFDAVQDSRLFGSPEFRAAYGPIEAKRIRREIQRQERRLLRPGGILIHSDIVSAGPPAHGLAATAVMLTIAFVVIAFVVGTGSLTALDTSFAPVMVLPLGTLGRKVAETINLGGDMAIAGLAALAGLVLARVRADRSWLILLAPLATIPIELLAKNVVPQTGFHNVTGLQIGSFLTIPAPYTFPSGSLARATALLLALLVHPSGARVVKVGPKARSVAAILSGAALTVAAWGHLAAGDHWASDIVGGLILGAAAAFTLGWLTQRHGSRRRLAP